MQPYKLNLPNDESRVFKKSGESPNGEPNTEKPAEEAFSRKISPLYSIKWILFGFTLLLIASILLSSTYFISNQYRYRKEEEVQANLEIARAVAKNFETFVLGVVRSQHMLGLALTSAQPLSRSDQARILDGFKTDNPSVRNVFWINPEGIITAADPSGTIGLGVNVHDRRYFREITEGLNWSVSEHIAHKATKTTGFAINRAIRDETGALLGVVSASFVPDRLDLALGVDRLKGGGVSLIDQSGMLVYRYPHMGPEREARNLLELYPSFINAALAGREVVKSLYFDHYGEMRITALTPISLYGWVAGADRSEKEVFEPVVSDILIPIGVALLFGLGVTVVAVMCTRKISHSITTLRKHALLLGRGEYDRRIETSGPKELRDLGRTFNKMAEDILAHQAARKKAHERLRRVLDSITEGYYLLDAEWRFLEMNPTAEKYFKQSAEHLVGRKIWSDSGISPTGMIKAKFQAAVESGKPLQFVAESSIDPGKWSAFYLYPRETGLEVYFQDITARKQAEESLRQLTHTLEQQVAERTEQLEQTIRILESEIEQREIAQDQLRQLTRKTVEAMEHDRRALSKEIHDSIGGSLAAIKMLLETQSKDPPGGIAPLETIIGHLAATLKETKRISHQLRPMALDDFGLKVAIRENLARFNEFYPQIRVDQQVHISGNQIPDEIITAVYRLIQEAFNNIGKHSRADYARIELAESEDRILLEVEDNGIGFDVSAILDTGRGLQGYGLLSMKERVEICRGRFRIESSPGKGTRIFASIPKKS